MSPVTPRRCGVADLLVGNAAVVIGMDAAYRARETTYRELEFALLTLEVEDIVDSVFSVCSIPHAHGEALEVPKIFVFGHSIL